MKMAGSDPDKGHGNHGCGNEQKDDQESVALPLRAALMRIDVDVRHG
jgi:hypothetical protein